MATPIDIQPASERELALARLIDAPRAAVYRCWTEPELLKRWFTPAPWQTVAAELDPRPGGVCCVTMRSPDGEDFPHPGVYLEVLPNEKLVFTDAYTTAWQPSEKPFMTGMITLEDAGESRTRYTARVFHWSIDDRASHEAMGFHTGWGQVADQLEAVARTL